MQEIDISYWKQEEIDQIAEALLEKVSDDQAQWIWKVGHHTSEDWESVSTAYWFLTGKSDELSIFMILGKVPWTKNIKFSFTRDRKKYVCCERVFDRDFVNLKNKLDEIAREIKSAQDALLKYQSEQRAELYERSQRQKAKKVIDLLKK